MRKHLRLIEGGAGSDQIDGCGKEMVLDSGERPLMTLEMVAQLSAAVEKEDLFVPLPAELMACLLETSGDKLNSYVKFCRRYKIVGDKVFDILNKKGFSKEKTFKAIEVFMSTVYLKLLRNLNLNVKNEIVRVPGLVLVNGQLDDLTDLLAEQIAKEIKESSLPGQIELMARMRSFIE